MDLIWNSPETVTIPNVGTVRLGARFSIEEDRGRDLLERGLAVRPTAQKKTDKIPRIDAAPQGKE